MNKPEDDPTETSGPQTSSESNTKEVRKVRPLSLFREDLSYFKENLLNVLKDKNSRATGQDKRSSVSALTLLREDLSQLREDVSSVFKLGQSREDASKIKVSSEEDEDSKTEGVEDGGGDEEDGSLTSENSDQLTVSEEDEPETSCVQEADQQESSTETIEPSDGSDRSSLSSSTEDGSTIDEPEDPEASFPESLPENILLVSRDVEKCDARAQLEVDPWGLKNFACYLTLDPNTANSELELSECNRKATRVWSDLRPCEHPDRFKLCPQVLCREGQLDNMYWEVEWSGGADIGVTYNSISRSGSAASCLLGHNERSWSLECQEGGYTASHNNRRLGSSSPKPFSHRVGVFLNWTAGSLSFYCVSPDAMTHIHTFQATFTEPVYPGFWVWAYEGSVTLCQVEMNWERLLQ